MNTIINRFKNQRVSQLIHLKNRPEGSLPERVENCHRLKSKFSHSVSLRKKEGAKKAHYGDLQTCGSVWSCQVCASIISERRCQQVQNSCDIWRDRDCQNSVSMITWTTPHNIKQPLSEVLRIQDRAMRIMKQQPQRNLYPVYRTILKEMCSVGAYTGRENTFGRKNGWHPHRHDLHFMVRANVSQLKKWRHALSVAWAIAFLKAGGEIDNFEAFCSRSVRIDQINPDDGYDRISKYITTIEGQSWSLAREATKGIVKLGKNGNITPFGMLEAIRHGDPHSRLYSAKFWEYAQTMKGKKQFFPTPGLSRFLGVDNKTDDELLQESSAGNHYAFLTHDQWDDINNLEIKGEVLAITEHLNEFEFMDELDKLIQAYQAEKAA
ncbi:hypothetical protein [Desulfospira joergensenii]|uniref:hypothetical protein n=1 Tax=Desulfospira joergensenii TaxID=53329 RepID=UPI0003B5DC02|nr:hypothetical protein [Desulfospira joergensenii]